MKKILLLGYGNPDREDDGVAWHILRALAVKMGLPAPDSYEDDFPENPHKITMSLTLSKSRNRKHL